MGKWASVSFRKQSETNSPKPAGGGGGNEEDEEGEGMVVKWPPPAVA